MPVRTGSDHNMIQPPNFDASSMKILEELQEGRQLTNTQHFPARTLYIKLALDYSFFRDNLLKFRAHLHEIKVFIRISFDIMYIVCKMEKELLSLVYSNGIVDICLPRFILREELKIFESCFYTHHDNRLRILQEEFSQLFKKIKVKASILCFSIEEMSMTNQEALPQSSRLFELLKCNNTMQREELQRRDFILTKEVKLSKTQVTFLIGSRGTRIETLRKESGATIKIIPISEKMTMQERFHPETVQQTILVSGDLYSVALAITNIESALFAIGL
ncbi:Mer1p [Saccharomyces eubayanus]|uniref:Mer1p n=1 Tax=Saccharomyces eubayanus TaxID=1080349 RepID=UPI0006C5FEBF|nr:MER1-like protein [Saccharomyces eubayanus]KOG96962.1 MER1-like protein [Saccharomyces eubayanus]